MSKKGGGKRRYWLVKSEPESYGIRDLARDGKTFWDGVRNYQARNFIRDDMKVGDGVLFYHSNAKPNAIVGLARVSREAYADFTQFDPDHPHYDPKSTEDDPRWLMVDLEFVAEFDTPLPLEQLKADPKLEGMALLQRGQRLSVQPVEPAHWRRIVKLAGVPAD